MSQKRIRKRPQCSQDNCGSRRFHVGDDGFTYCDQGHQQSELGTVIAEDTGELVIHGKTSRKKDSDAESQTSKVSGFSGPKAFEHYLLCLQLILRKQLRWLIDVQKLPEELETLVRDLWALRLQKLQGKASHDSETDTEAASSRVFSSQSEGGSGTDSEAASSHRSRTASRKRSGGPSLADLVCLIYIGILLLRIPLTVADLHKMINDGELLFYSAVKELPLGMRNRLPGHLQEQLEPQTLIAPDALHRNILRLLSALNSDFGMVVPPINHPLVLYRWIKELCLPLEVYVGAQRLGRILDTDFSFTLDAAASASRTRETRIPELRLACLVVITTKLLFPFDTQKRYPRSANDMSALRMDWDLWTRLQQQEQSKEDHLTEENQLSFQEAFTMTEAKSLDLADSHLDQYLDWYETNIASEEVRDRGRAGREVDFRRALFEMFPTQRQQSKGPDAVKMRDFGKTSAERLVQVQAGLETGRMIKDEDAEDVPRTGSLYMQYRAVEELDGAVRVFYEKAAGLAGYSLHGVVRAVFSMERKLMKAEKGLRERQSERGEAEGT